MHCGSVHYPMVACWYTAVEYIQFVWITLNMYGYYGLVEFFKVDLSPESNVSLGACCSKELLTGGVFTRLLNEFST